MFLVDLLGVENLQYLRLVIASDGFAIVPVNGLEELRSAGGSRFTGCIQWRGTHERSEEVVFALLESLQSILLVAGTLDDLGDAASADVAQDGLNLVGGGRGLGDVEFEGLAAGLRLGRVVASLVEGGASLSVGRDLLDEVGDLHRGRGAGLVEDGDNVERSVLFCGEELTVSFLTQSQVLRAIQAGYPVQLHLRSETL